LAPNDADIVLSDAGFISQIMQHIRWPVMAILLQPCWALCLMIFM